MRIAICEDNSAMQDVLKKLLMQFKSTCTVRAFDTTDQLWFGWQESRQPFDVLILDIETPGSMNGLDAAKQIRKIDHAVEIILLSAHTRYALPGYDVHPYCYLLKPFAKEELFGKLAEIEQVLKRKKSSWMVIRNKSGTHRVLYDDILYCESKGHDAFIHTGSETFKIKKKLSELIELCDNRFLCPHKSYLVNVHYVTGLNQQATIITMSNGDQVPVSKYKRKAFLANFQAYCAFD